MRKRFKPYILQENSIRITNFYVDEDGKKYGLQDHLKIPKYSFFEIQKVSKNELYGKYDDYIKDGYVESFGGNFLNKGNNSIDKSAFISEYTCYVLAYFEDLKTNDEPNLKFVCSRPFDLPAKEKLIFFQLAKKAHEDITNMLKSEIEWVK